ncbi:NUDIX domain-containing protein [Roseibium sediminicola]|uniref:NUDIX domain-containing protein n=1 Tax=Roseibium sediminicola TaxID=2933272 RepID=A0ABT0GWG8_9HYPH|nr:NUDIX domain-containing protein [Roseibium sp. CAU 1639]MCK7613790.1 NUDIX domain-containing protein [Roseibium sp. CAU 1639]
MILCAGPGAKVWHGPASDQPLRSKGKRQVQKIGAYLGKKRLRPDRVLTSPAKRARASAEKALKAAGWTVRGLAISDELAAGHLPSLTDCKRPLLVVLPEEAKALLGRQGIEAGVTPGALIRIGGEPDRPRLVARIDPKDLSDLFPFPAPDGPERRPRPAYYYRQSAVIPFRRIASGTEVLIIGSSSGRHWTVPKGIVEPGLSPAASARIEAREEAGVEGTVGRTPLGHFTYAKWGATCEVTVYPMEVRKVLDGGAWEEHHRTRKWVPGPETAALLKQPAFALLAARV